MPTLSRILVPVDFAVSSRAAVDYALLLGSVAERLVRRAPCAVLTVREKPNAD